MTQAAKRGEIYHLWWHPHNFGVNQTENLAGLETILKHYATLEKSFEMKSKTMAEVTPETEPIG